MGRGRRFDDAACSMWLVRVAEGGRMKASIAEAVLARAAGRCEHCGVHFDNSLEGGVEFDHALSRREPDSIDTIWALRRACHREKTDSIPDAATWLRCFAQHAARNGYRVAFEKALRRLQWVQQRVDFGEAL